MPGVLSNLVDQECVHQSSHSVYWCSLLGSVIAVHYVCIRPTESRSLGAPAFCRHQQCFASTGSIVPMPAGCRRSRRRGPAVSILHHRCPLILLTSVMRRCLRAVGRPECGHSKGKYPKSFVVIVALELSKNFHRSRSRRSLSGAVQTREIGGRDECKRYFIPTIYALEEFCHKTDIDFSGSVKISPYTNGTGDKKFVRGDGLSLVVEL